MGKALTVSVQQAAGNLGELLENLAQGDEMVIVRDGTPLARVVPIERPLPKPRQPGRLAGQIDVPDSFFDPLPEEELKAWGLG